MLLISLFFTHSTPGISFNFPFLSFFFLNSAMIISVITDVIESGAACTIVCMAEDPMALLRNQPDLYNMFQSTYNTVLPRV